MLPSTCRPTQSPHPHYHHRHDHHHSLLRLLNNTTTLPHLKQAHAHILRLGHGRDTAFLTSLLRLYCSHSRPRVASLLLSHFPSTPPTFAFNLLIRALPPRDALVLYNRMLALGVPPDKFTFPFAVRACSVSPAPGFLRKGQEIHGFAVKVGFYGDVYLQNCLMHLYFCCRDLEAARMMFDKMRVRSVVSWTTAVSGLVSCGEVKAARLVFERMPVRNVVSWTAMIDGYARNGWPEEAFRLFQQMQMENVVPNEFTLIGLLIACTELGSIELGRWVHDFAHKNGGLERDVFVGTALIDMYSNCGSLDDAVRVFEQMPVKSLATWNSMITSLGVHGHGAEAVALFNEMEKDGIVKPDGITFIGVLCACLRGGMVNRGLWFFRRMIEYYEILPRIQHWNCLVALLDHKNSEGKASELMRNLSTMLDAQGPHGLVRVIELKMKDDVELKKLMHKHICNLKISSVDGKNYIEDDLPVKWEGGWDEIKLPKTNLVL